MDIIPLGHIPQSFPVPGEFSSHLEHPPAVTAKIVLTLTDPQRVVRSDQIFYLPKVNTE